MIVAAIAGETTSSSSGQPAAASSSQTIASSVMPPPPPPYSVGHVDAEVAELAGLGPQFVGVLAGLGLGDEVRVAVARGQRGDRVAQLALLGGVSKFIASSSGRG